MKNHKMLVIEMFIVLMTFIVGIVIGFTVGYTKGNDDGKEYVIYEQEIEGGERGTFLATIDGETHIYE